MRVATGAIIVCLLWFGAVKPMLGEAQFAKAKLAVMQKDGARARAHILEALKHDPENTLYQQELGQVNLILLKDYDQAVFWFEKAMEDFNGDIVGWAPHMMIGLCRLHQGRYGEAKEQFETAFRYNPNLDDAQRLIAIIEKEERK